MTQEHLGQGTIIKVAGALVVADGMQEAKMYEVVRVSEQGLIGEIIARFEKAGLKVSDIIIGIDDVVIQNSRDIEELLLSEDLRVGDEMEFVIFRDHKIYHRLVTLKKRN